MMLVISEHGNANEDAFGGFDHGAPTFNIGIDTNSVEVQITYSTQKMFGVDTMDQLEHYAHIITYSTKLRLSTLPILKPLLVALCMTTSVR